MPALQRHRARRRAVLLSPTGFLAPHRSRIGAPHEPTTPASNPSHATACPPRLRLKPLSPAANAQTRPSNEDPTQIRQRLARRPACSTTPSSASSRSRGPVRWGNIAEIVPSRVRPKGQSVGSSSHWIALYSCSIARVSSSVAGSRSNSFAIATRRETSTALFGASFPLDK